MELVLYIMFNFIFYSFVGWIIEEVYGFAITKSFKKPNFLYGPIKPMYGITMVILITLHELLKVKGIPFILFCFLVPTTVEYISGYILKILFDKVYWSYLNHRCNLNGYICLKFSLYWLVLSFIGVYYFQPIVKSMYSIFNSEFLFLFIILINSIAILDFTITIIKANKKT